MKRHKGILFSSILLLSTSGIAAPVTKGSTYRAPVTKGAVYQAPAANLAVPQWEVHVFGGVATLDAENTEIQTTSFETDELEQTNSDSWSAWTVTAGVGYIFPLFDAKLNSDDVQWFTAVQPQLNVYYLQGDINGEVDRFNELAGNFNDTDYTMDFSSTRLMFDTSLTVMSWRMLSLYAIGGIGVSWNDFDLDAEGNNCVQAMDLDGNDTNFVWEVGAGITYAATDNFGVSFEYLFTQFDGLELGENDDDDDDFAVFEIESDSFNLNSQALMLGLRYAF